MKTYTLEAASKLLKRPVSELKEYIDYKRQLPILEELNSVGVTNTEIVIQLSHYDNAYHVEHFYIEYKNDSKYQFYFNKSDRSGYSLYSYIHYKNIDNYKRQTIVEPNHLVQLKNIKKPTLKKITELFENELQKNILFEQAENECENKVNAFLEDFKTFAEANKDKLTNVYQWNDLKVGKLETEEFHYRYEISSNGYIYETMKYAGESTLEAFKNKVK